MKYELLLYIFSRKIVLKLLQTLIYYVILYINLIVLKAMMKRSRIWLLLEREIHRLKNFLRKTYLKVASELIY